jgi:cation:H+ antiporter
MTQRGILVWPSSAGLISALVRLKVLASLSRAGAGPAVWACPGMLASAFLVAWGAEAAQALVGQGLALALLAWLQTLPEFGVEAVIAWHAGQDPAQAGLAIANLTGAIRLLIGLGWPLVYAVQAVAGRAGGRRGWGALTLRREDAVGIGALGAALGYSAWIVAKGSFTPVDAGVLAAVYLGYLVFAARVAPDDHPVEVTPAVARWALARPRWRVVRVSAVCALGGALLVMTAHPFFTSMLAVATVLGIAPFLVVQWLAPVLTELPELVSAGTWARRVTPAPMALMNLVSSGVNQWTILAAMIPIVFGWAHWRRFGVWAPFTLDPAQRFELLLALLQTGVGVGLLARLALGPWAAGGLLGLWVVQVALPTARPVVAWAYGIWLVGIVLTGVARWRRPPGT